MVTDAKPHTILITRKDGSMDILLNNNIFNESATTSSHSVTLNVSSDHLFLGAEVDVKTGAVVHGFTGCLTGIRLDRKELPLSDISNEDFTFIKHSGIVHESGRTLSSCPALNVAELNQPAIYVYSGIIGSIALIFIISVVFIISCASLNAWRRSRQGKATFHRQNDSHHSYPAGHEFSLYSASLNNFLYSAQSELSNVSTNNPSSLEPRSRASDDFLNSIPAFTQSRLEVTSFSPSHTHSHSSSQQLSLNQMVPLPNEGLSAVNPMNPDHNSPANRNHEDDRDGSSIPSDHRLANNSSLDAKYILDNPPIITDLSTRAKQDDRDCREPQIDTMKSIKEENNYDKLLPIASA